MDDIELARHLAAAAGDELLRIRREELDPPDLQEAGDAGSQRVLARILAEHRPDDAVLSEEAADDVSRVDADRVWIIDPVDGTRQYGVKGRDDWAIHIALWDRACEAPDRLRLGVVAIPSRGIVHDTATATRPAPHDPPRFVVSASRPPDFVRTVADALGAKVVPMGSAGVKGTAMLRGEAEAYLHAGGQYEWDNAAPVAVARAAGLHVSRIDGSPIEYNRPNPRMPDLLICYPELAAPILDALGAP